MEKHMLNESSAAAPSPAPASVKPELTVWLGPMPESNGKSNFTAILMRKGADLLEGVTGGITIERSEYPDRVRYEADRMRYLIGELDVEPCILDYDPDKHSGYKAPASDVVQVPRDVAKALLDEGSRAETWKAQDKLRALLNGGRDE